MIRVRLHSDALTLAAFLEAEEYPAHWSPETLEKYTLMCRVEEAFGDGRVYLAGYVWATWRADGDCVMDFHACLTPSYRGRWLTKSVAADLLKLAELCGVKVLSTTTIGDRAARLVRVLLQRRMDFSVAPDGTLSKIIKANM